MNNIKVDDTVQLSLWSPEDQDYKAYPGTVLAINRVSNGQTLYQIHIKGVSRKWWSEKELAEVFLPTRESYDEWILRKCKEGGYKFNLHEEVYVQLWLGGCTGYKTYTGTVMDYRTSEGNRQYCIVIPTHPTTWYNEKDIVKIPEQTSPLDVFSLNYKIHEFMHHALYNQQKEKDMAADRTKKHFIVGHSNGDDEFYLFKTYKEAEEFVAQSLKSLPRNEYVIYEAINLIKVKQPTLDITNL